MKLEPIIIESHDGAAPLAGLRYIPQQVQKPIGVVLAHGFTSAKHSMDSPAAYLAERGYACVTFDVVGHKLGCTGGVMHHICQAADNLAQALAWARKNLSVYHTAVIGHSMGAAAAIQVAAWESSEPNANRPLSGIACLCMGLNPMAGFETALGAAMLTQRADYVRGAPAKELLAGLNGMLDSASQIDQLAALMIAARSDVLLPVSSVHLLAERIGPSAEVRTIEAMHLDAPEKSRGILFRWLEGLGVGR
jgi:pimeloyl-ACP methyl ester carboxylesterase